MYSEKENLDRAAEEGMKQVNLPYSGHYGFVQTEMYWPVNHMVSPKSQAVQCGECHTRENGRLANLSGFYLPGRNYNPWVEFLGVGLLVLTLAATVVHGSVRFLMNRKRKGSN